MDYSGSSNPSDLFSAKGLVIVITGGGTGIGLAFTTALARSGASKIFLLGRRLSALESAASSTDSSIVVPVVCDVTSPSSLKMAAETVASQSPGGHVDVLINNAGVEGPKATDVTAASSIEELAAAMSRGIGAEEGEQQQQQQPGSDGWDLAWRTNAVAVIGVAAAFLPLLDRGNERRGWARGKKAAGDGNRQTETATMKKHAIEEGDRRSSQIITVASISAFNRTVTAGLAYTASKAGAVMLGKSMANFLAPWGIRSNMIAPGRYPSEMMTDPTLQLPIEQIPHGSPGTYQDLASLILYMVGKSGAYLNGAVQVVDGGRLSMMPATF